MSMFRSLITICAAFTAAVVAGCGSIDLAPRQQKATQLAEQGGWTLNRISAGSFDLVSYISPHMSAGKPLVVYIEGDGLAFLGSHTISPDPTPDDPVALRLALLQPENAVYLARPCQYAFPDHARNCEPAIWTGRRYAPEVVASTNAAIDELKRGIGSRAVILVGYSGGGAIAVLAAASRRDVAGIVTVAANLDVGYWAGRDKLAPLSGSLDPVDVAARIASIPQVHFAGSDDKVVGPDVTRSYLRRLGNAPHVRFIEIAGFTHSCCWVEQWPELARRAEFGIISGWQ